MAVIFHADAGFKTPKDLVGKKIAITQGDALSQIFPALLESNGVKADAVNMVAMGTPAAKETALLQKQVDGLLGYYYEQAPRLEATANVKLGVMRFSDFGVTLYNMSLVAANDMIQNKPDLIREFVAALNEAWDYAAKNPAEAADILSKYAPQFDKKLAQQQFLQVVDLTHTANTKGKPLGWMSQEDWAKGLQLLKQYGGLTGDVRPELYYTNDFIGK